MAELWRTEDRLGREVFLTDARLDHILAEHDELADSLDEISTTVERPDLVRRDRRYAHRENHYRRPSPDQLWMKVVVHYRPVPPQGTWEGEIITAYSVEDPEPKEAPLWP